MRHVNGIMYMDIDDLRKEFLYTSGLQEKSESLSVKEYLSFWLMNVLGTWEILLNW